MARLTQPTLNRAIDRLGAVAAIWQEWSMNKAHPDNDSVPFSVMLVEDNVSVRQRLRGLIDEKRGLHVVAEAGTVAEARALFDSVHPDAVLLDLALLGGSGMDVLRHIRHDGGRSVVIVLSNYLEPETYNRCSELGADFLFSKSDEFEQAIETLSALAEREVFANKHPANARRCRAQLAVTSPVGIHARPAAMLVKQAQMFDADIEISHNGNSTSVKSIIGLLTLCAGYGAKVTVTATGRDADEAIRVITNLFVRGFDEIPVPDAAATQTTGPGKGEMILVADDSADLRSMVRAILEKHGYRVVEARNGVEAVALLTANTGDIRAVILDMIMKELDGRETMSILRCISPALPVLAISGDKQKAPVADDSPTTFIKKPFGAAILLPALQDLLER